MKKVFVPIDKIANMPIERVKLYCEYDGGFVDEATSSIICNNDSVRKIFYYIQKDNKQYIDLESDEPLKVIILKGDKAYSSYVKESAPYYYSGETDYNEYFKNYKRKAEAYYNKWHNNFDQAKASWNEIVTYLILNEWPKNGFRYKNNMTIYRTETGRFVKGNKCACYDALPINLIIWSVKKYNIFKNKRI